MITGSRAVGFIRVVFAIIVAVAEPSSDDAVAIGALEVSLEVTRTASEDYDRV